MCVCREIEEDEKPDTTLLVCSERKFGSCLQIIHSVFSTNLFTSKVYSVVYVVVHTYKAITWSTYYVVVSMLGIVYSHP